MKGKKLGFGCVDSKSERIEKVEDVKTTVERVAEIIGIENMLIDPDCGLRMLPHEVAYKKLEIVGEVKRRIMED